MNKVQGKDVFIERALYGPQDQKMIDEYISISAGSCSRERFLNFLKDKLQMDGKRGRVGWRDQDFFWKILLYVVSLLSIYIDGVVKTPQRA